jgi:hypothetical protein
MLLNTRDWAIFCRQNGGYCGYCNISKRVGGAEHIFTVLDSAFSLVVCCTEVHSINSFCVLVAITYDRKDYPFLLLNLYNSLLNLSKKKPAYSLHKVP